jgi:hypothetical protein
MERQLKKTKRKRGFQKRPQHRKTMTRSDQKRNSEQKKQSKAQNKKPSSLSVCSGSKKKIRKNSQRESIKGVSQDLKT